MILNLNQNVISVSFMISVTCTPLHKAYIPVQYGFTKTYENRTLAPNDGTKPESVAKTCRVEAENIEFLTLLEIIFLF